MCYFYLVAFLPIIAGLILLAKDREIIWQEFIGSAAIAFALSGIFHAASFWDQTRDYNTVSGIITQAIHYPFWMQRVVTHIKTKTGSTTIVTHVPHPEHWNAFTSTDDVHSIGSSFFGEVTTRFADLSSEFEFKPGFEFGDPHIYVSRNKTGFLYPTTDWREFENRVKCVPNIFKFSKIPEGVAVYGYPKNTDFLRSDRLVGPIRSLVDSHELDLLNSRIGGAKQVNLILVGFRNRDDKAAQYQQAAWAGGRKNDLVLCFDASNSPPAWANCFGWTEKEIVKRNLEGIALTSGVTTATLPLIEKEIVQNYTIKNWHKFDYINIPPPKWALIWFPIAMIAIQAGYWMWANTNEYRA